jgi:chromosome segregation ATPase
VKNKKRPLTELASAALDLEDELTAIEALTRRLSRLELDSRKSIVGAAELLKEAADGHTRFAMRLRSVVESIDTLRRRQNESAAALSGLSESLDQRRRAHDELGDRFTALGHEARKVAELFQATAPAEGAPELGREELRAKVATAGDSLATLVESARALATDAADAKMTDLHRDADALRQQLQALSNKLKQAAIAPE